MAQIDERILEYLSEESYASPEEMVEREVFAASRARIRERLSVLARHNLVAPWTDDWQAYELTERGERYLAGDLDGDALPDPWADGRSPRVWWLSPN